MYCLDTNIIIDIFRGDQKLKDKFISLKKLNAKVFTTSPTLCELYRGAYLSNILESSLRLIDDFLDSIEILLLDKTSSEEYGKEFARLQKLGKMTNIIDLMIASIVKTNNLILVTRNKKDFENINVKVEVW